MERKIFKDFSNDFLKNTDIQEYGRYVTTRITNIKDELKGDYCPYEDEWNNEDWYVTIGINDMEVLIDETDFEDYGEYDEYELDELIGNLIKKAKHYLIVGYGSNWRGQTGIKFANDIKECFLRNYDCSQYVLGGSIGKKVLSIKESHHDCPMGFECIIIALTDIEYNKLQNAEFNEVVEFADTFRKKIQYI